MDQDFDLDSAHCCSWPWSNTESKKNEWNHTKNEEIQWWINPRKIE